HRGLQSARELTDHAGQWTAERNAALDALGHQLVLAERIVLEIAVFRVRLRSAAALHRPERTHPAVALELLAVDEDQLARRFRGTREQRAEHRRGRTSG